MNHEMDCSRFSSYVFIALVALVVGMLLGVAGRDSHTGSRIEWPRASHPKSNFPP
jgi:prepilin signal peptidase PulO-like enzyme (type II secretory pathway)